MRNKSAIIRLLLVVTLAAVLSLPAGAATVSNRYSKTKQHSVTESAHTKKKLAQSQHSRPVARTATRKSVVKKAALRRRRVVRHRYYERFTGNSFAENQTTGDVIAGEDSVVRQAAIDALGNMNGTVVAVDPNSGRILAMVNQDLALSEGATPCSTIKLSVALSALSEGIISKDTKINLGGGYRMNLTDALAHSNNTFFEILGRQLGFEKVSYYAHQFGLGELAGYDIPGEHLGTYPTEVLPEKEGGVGKMCSFGESVNMTPLQLAAMVSAIANGGTLYYLQHPTTPEEVSNFHPRVKRHLDIAGVVPEMLDGMAGAVHYGTARSVRYNFNEEEILGKTGTCSKDGVRFGWFASYANTQYGKIVTVIFLHGGRPTFGPKAAELTGHLYRELYDHDFFAAKPAVMDRTSMQGATQ
jgi:cell division protein FtsI/penicillin-binding protein 2